MDSENQSVKEIKPSELGNEVKFSDIKPIKGINIDLEQYDKKEVVIGQLEVTQVPSEFTSLIEGTEQHHMQWILKVSSEVLETIGEGEDKIEFRASELFNLIQNDKGQLEGFPTGKSSNLMKFMNDLKIEKPEEMKDLQEVIDSIKGKKTLVKTYKKEQNGKTKTYLKFRY